MRLTLPTLRDPCVCIGFYLSRETTSYALFLMVWVMSAELRSAFPCATLKWLGLKAWLTGQALAVSKICSILSFSASPAGGMKRSRSGWRISCKGVGMTTTINGLILTRSVTSLRKRPASWVPRWLKGSLNPLSMVPQGKTAQAVGAAVSCDQGC